MIRPLPVQVDPARLDALHEKLRLTRLGGPPAPGEAWSMGADRAFVARLVDHWRERFDWRDWEGRLAAYENLEVDVDGLKLHCLRARSPETGALPLVMTHGWPGSVLEFLKILPLLTDPAAHGGDAADAFEVVCPSLPGFGFSAAPTQPGYDVKAAGETLAKMMEALGYRRYGAQGGDWGAMASPYLALAAPQACIGLHLNLVLAPCPPGEDPRTTLTPRELAAFEQARAYMRSGTGYQKIQATRPETLAVALGDSPAGLAAWIVDGFRSWSDCGGDVERRFSLDELLANVTLYWLTETAGSSMRLYFESRASGRFGPVERPVEVPTGCAIFPQELFRPPRRWAERLFNVVHWTEMEAGGHFAAMEESEALARDLRAFFRPLRG